MDRAYQSGAAGSAPAAPASPSIGYPTAGNPGTGTPATTPGPYWYHMLTEELLAVITAAGITPARGNLTQLLTALRAAGVFQTAAAGDSTTKAATTEFVQRELSTSSLAFRKADRSTVVFTKTGNGTASIKAGTAVGVNGKVVQFASDTAIVMPTLTAGTDYAVYVCDDGTVRADASFTAPTGYTTTNSRKIGGFHYAPGGHSGSPGGGNATPQINAYSFWDLKFRPECQDPRGMALVADGFWADIYLLGVDHLTNGTSKYNVTIADGASPPKIPTKFGGTGSNAYTTLNWWEAAEVMRSWGKRLPTYSEFAALAYGTTEATSIGTDPVSTTWNATYISKWGMAQASGNMWVWGDEFGGGAAAAAWTANTGGRGSTYQMENAVYFGGDWGDTSYSGSRASYWSSSPTASDGGLGARGVCDHVILE